MSEMEHKGRKFAELEMGVPINGWRAVYGQTINGTCQNHHRAVPWMVFRTQCWTLDVARQN